MQEEHDCCQAAHCQEMPTLQHSHKRPPRISAASVCQLGALSPSRSLFRSACAVPAAWWIPTGESDHYDKEKILTHNRGEQNKIILYMSLNGTFIAQDDKFIFHLFF